MVRLIKIFFPKLFLFTFCLLSGLKLHITKVNAIHHEYIIFTIAFENNHHSSGSARINCIQLNKLLPSIHMPACWELGHVCPLQIEVTLFNSVNEWWKQQRVLKSEAGRCAITRLGVGCLVLDGIRSPAGTCAVRPDGEGGIGQTVTLIPLCSLWMLDYFQSHSPFITHWQSLLMFWQNTLHK